MQKSLTVTTQGLIEYLDKVKELEASCYQQRRILNGLQREIRQSYSNVRKWSATIQKSAPAKPKKRIIGNVLWPILCGILGFGVGGFLYYIILLLLIIPSFLNRNINAFADAVSDNPDVIMKIVGIGCICACIVVRVKNKIDENKEYAFKLRHYNEEQATSKKNINLMQSRIPRLQTKLEEAENMLAETQSILNRVYGVGYIYPKYQALIPVCSILEFLESGICDTLTGPNGAYNLYENQLRLNIIIAKMDDVIRRLDDISDNQRMLANVIRESEQRTRLVLSSISDTLSDIEKNTEYTQYYSSVTAANSSHIAWLNTYQYIDSKK